MREKAERAPRTRPRLLLIANGRLRTGSCLSLKKLVSSLFLIRFCETLRGEGNQALAGRLILSSQRQLECERGIVS